MILYLIHYILHWNILTYLYIMVLPCHSHGHPNIYLDSTHSPIYILTYMHLSLFGYLNPLTLLLQYSCECYAPYYSHKYPSSRTYITIYISNIKIYYSLIYSNSISYHHFFWYNNPTHSPRHTNILYHILWTLLLPYPLLIHSNTVAYILTLLYHTLKYPSIYVSKPPYTQIF